jgi:pteridine reductase
MRRRAIVVGAARRVGRAVALELAARGWDLLLTVRPGGTPGAPVADECRQAAAAAGTRAEVDLRELDLADPDGIERFVRGADGPVDALVLSASGYGHSPFGTIAAAEAERELRVNAVAPLLLGQGFAPALAASSLRGGGAIVAFGDIHAAGRPRRSRAPYLMSKAALHAMVEALALELAPRVRVNAVLPGVVAWPDDAPEAERAAYEARIPLGRPGTPEDAACAVRALIEDMPYVTGTLLRLDGGRWLR